MLFYSPRSPALSRLAAWGLLFVPLLGQAAVSGKCQREWNEWYASYGGGSPLVAQWKTSQWPVTGDEIQEVIDGHKRITLPYSDIKQSGRTLSELDLSEFEGLSEESARFRAIVKAVSDLRSTRKPTELLLIFTGQYHAYDIFLKARPSETVYSFATLNQASLLDTRRSSSRVADSNWYLHGAFLGALSETLNDGKPFTVQSLLRTPRPKRVGTVIFGDIHPLRETRWIDRFPDGQCLYEMGYRSVRVGMEGVECGTSTSIRELKTLFAQNCAGDGRPGAQALFSKLNRLKSHLRVSMGGIDSFQ